MMMTMPTSTAPPCCNRSFILELFLDAEHRLSSRLAALTAAGRPVPPAESREHATQLLLTLQQAARRAGRADATLDLGRLLHLTCTPVGSARAIVTAGHGGAASDFCLGLRLAPGAAEVWLGAVTESTAPRLSLLAPELLAALRLGGGVLPGDRAASSLFCASSVWAALAARRVQFATSDPCAPYRERLSRRRAAAALFPRIAPAHLRNLLLPMVPGDVDADEDAPGGSYGAGRLALEELCSLLDASLPTLRAHALRSLADRAVAASEDGSAGFGGAPDALAADGAACLREVRQRRRHLGTLLWLQRQVAVAAEAECTTCERAGGGRAGGGNVAAARSLLREWAAADGVARAERAVLVRAAANPEDAPAAEAYSRLTALHSRWRLELAARDGVEQQCDIRNAAGQAGISALLERAARQAVNRAWSVGPLHPARSVRTIPAADGDAAAAILGSAPLCLTDDGDAGARRAAAALVRGLVQEPRAEQAAAPADVEPPMTSDAMVQLTARLAAVAGIFRMWSAHIEAGGDGGGAPSHDPPALTDPCPLHEQWLELLLCAMEQGGTAAVLRVRATAAIDARPILSVGEEESLYAALMAGAGLALQESEHAHSAQLRPPEVRLACVKMALLSRHAALADEAVRFLCAAPADAAAVTPARAWVADGPAPPADGELVRLVLRGGRLGEVACSPYWAELAPHAARLESEALLVEAMGALARHRLYEAAGALLLDRHSTHPALRSTAAKLAALRAFFRDRATAIESDVAHPLRTLWEMV